MPQRNKHQTGLSLVELMVAMVISLVLLAGVSQVYLSNKQTYVTQDALARMQENGRFAIDTITEDLRRAGYMGGNADLTVITGSESPVTPATTCETGNNNWGRMIEQRVFGLNDANTNYACIPNSDYLRGDILVVRYASPSVATAFDANRLYLRSTLFGSRMFVGSKQGDSANDVTSSMPAAVREMAAHAYYIRGVNRDCNGTNTTVPALFRESLDINGRPAAQELVSGVENFQVQYGIDTDSDGFSNRYRNANAVTNWQQVRSVRVWLLSRSDCPEPTFTNTNTYAMGDQNFTPAGADQNFRRQLYTSTVMLRN